MCLLRNRKIPPILLNTDPGVSGKEGSGSQLFSVLAHGLRHTSANCRLFDRVWFSLGNSLDNQALERSGKVCARGNRVFFTAPKTNNAKNVSFFSIGFGS